MAKLRECLEQLDVSLYQSFIGSWDIAVQKWLPTLQMDSESHGGLPHVQDVEICVDKIADSCKPIWSKHGEVPFGFNALEVYITLCAVLFHDIGRGRPSSEPHGKVSSDILAQSWAQLGIVSERVAIEIGHICEYHTAEEPSWNYHDLVMIHPWGPIHTQAIASLLTLADELDTAYTRSVPEYMKDPDMIFGSGNSISLAEMERMDGYLTKGHMREFISDVDLDPGSRLIKTVVFQGRLPGHDSRVENTASGKWLNRFIEKTEKDTGESVQSASDIKLNVSDTFKPVSYFFSLLMHLQIEQDREVLEFLAEQFLKADQYKHTVALRKFQDWIAADKNLDYPYTPNLLYSLQLWDKELTGIGSQVRARTRQEINDIKRTISFIGLTIDRINKLVCENSLQFKVNKVSSCYKSGILKSCIDKIKPPDDLCSIEAHRLLIDLFMKLLEIDLLAAVKSEPSKTGFIERKLERWKLRDFHKNMLLAFHIYLANARCLIEKDLDYRSMGYGKAEQVFGGKEPLTSILSGIFQTSEGTVNGRSPKDVEQRKHEMYESKTDLLNALNKHVESYKGYGEAHKIKGADFECALRIIFMQWLSNDIAAKNKTLKRIKSGLQKLEIPFDEWMIDYSNLLFDSDWNIRIEPSLDVKSLGAMFEAVYELQNNLHTDESLTDTPRVSWHSLAASLKDAKMERVKTGAARLKNLLKIFNNEEAWKGSKEESLHFGHWLLADLSRDDDKTNDYALDTSYSSWTLKTPESTKPDDITNNVKTFLKKVKR